MLTTQIKIKDIPNKKTLLTLGPKCSLSNIATTLLISKRGQPWDLFRTTIRGGGGGEETTVKFLKSRGGGAITLAKWQWTSTLRGGGELLRQIAPPPPPRPKMADPLLARFHYTITTRVQ